MNALGTPLEHPFLRVFQIMTNLYKVLNVSKHATRKQIKEAYYILSKQVHPDINHSKNSQDFVEISRAYAILSNPESRRDYDATLKERSNARPVYNARTRFYPDDYILHKNKSAKRSYNFKEWDAHHYPHDFRKSDQLNRELRSKQQYQERRKAPSVFAYTGLVMIAVFLVNSGWVELLYL